MKKSIFTIAVILALVVAVLLLFFPMQSAAADPTGASYVATTGSETVADIATTANKAYFGANYTWVMICAFMVFFFQCGFAMVETGFCRGKNAAHTITMNFMVFLVGAIGYFLVGFALQMGGSGGAVGLGSGGVLCLGRHAHEHFCIARIGGRSGVCPAGQCRNAQCGDALADAKCFYHKRGDDSPAHALQKGDGAFVQHGQQF